MDGNIDEGVEVACCGIAGVVTALTGFAAELLPMLGVGVLEGVDIVGFTVKEFRELGGTPGVAVAAVAGLRAGRGGAAMSVFHSRTVYKVASSVCGSMIIWHVPTLVIHFVGGLFSVSCSPFFFLTGLV